MGEWLRAWDDCHYELRDLRGSGNQVFAEGWQQGRGKGSGVEVSEEIYMVWTVQDGKAVRLRMFRDHEQAVEALGA